MKKPDFPDNEGLRLETLQSLQVLDTEAEERFDRITRLAKRLFDVPISLVSLIDSDRQWFKSKFGLDASETHRDISFCGHTILGDEVFVIPNALEDERFADNPLVTGNPNIRFYAGFPLEMPNQTRMGTLCIIDTVPREFSEEDVETLKDLGKLVQDELVSLQLATLDELTGISNRRGFLMLAQKSLSNIARSKSSAALVYLDLDNFKCINDELGHEAGDFALQSFSKIIEKVFRESDVFGRLGGDEFAVLLTETDSSEVNAVLGRLQRAIDKHNELSEVSYELGFSFGIVDYHSQKHIDILTLMSEADELMYQHKQQKKSE